MLAFLALSSCTLFKPTLAPTELKTDQPLRIYEMQTRKKAQIRLKDATSEVIIKITGDSIDLKLIAPENASIKAKGRKRVKRQHSGGSD